MDSYYHHPFRAGSPEYPEWLDLGSTAPAVQYWSQFWGGGTDDRSKYQQLSIDISALDGYVDPDARATDLPTRLKLFEARPDFFTPLNQYLVLPEYEIIYDWLCTDTSVSKQAVWIKGHSGQGLSVFRYYLLYRRLLESKPTLFINFSALLLFHEQGVAITLLANLTTPILRNFAQCTWVLVDRNYVISDEDASQLATGDSRIVYPASDSEAGWRYLQGWGKGSRVVDICYMRSWTVSDLQYGCALHRLQWADIQHRIRRVGPLPRDCLVPQIEYNRRVDEITRIIESMEGCDAGDILLRGSDPVRTSTGLVMKSRRDAADLRSGCTTVLLSDYVTVLLRARLLCDSRKKAMERAVVSLFQSYDHSLDSHELEGDLVEPMRRELYFLCVMKVQDLKLNVRAVDVQSSSSRTTRRLRSSASKTFRWSWPNPEIRHSCPQTVVNHIIASAFNGHAEYFQSDFRYPSVTPAVRPRTRATQGIFQIQIPQMAQHFFNPYPSGPDGIITQDLHQECLYIPRISPALAEPDDEGLFHAHGYAFFVRQGFLYFLQHCTAGNMSFDPAIGRLRRLFRGIPMKSKWHIIFLPDRAPSQDEELAWTVPAGKTDKWENVAKVVECKAYYPWQQQKSQGRHRR